MKKIVLFFIFLLSAAFLLLFGTSNNQKLSNENTQLKNTISQLESKITDLENNNKDLKLEVKMHTQNTPIISYEDVYDYKLFKKQVFIEKQDELLAMPTNDSYGINIVFKNTVATVIYKGIVKEEEWLFIQVPTYDTPSNNRGWIKKDKTVEFTADLSSKVQNSVSIKQGTKIYVCFNFSDILKTAPEIYNGENAFIRLDIKQDGWCRLQAAGGRTLWVKEEDIVLPMPI